LMRYPFGVPGEREKGVPECVMQTFVKHSQARAIASALLSAATEVRNSV
jgi:hypothetical protein